MGIVIDHLVASLVIISSLLHPCRDLLLKGLENPLTAYLGVCLGWCVLAGGQAMLYGGGLSLDANVWGLAVLSALGLAIYYFGTLEALRTGHLSVYYPIIRSSPLAIVAFNWSLFGQSYSWMVLIGISLIVASGILLQWSGGRLVENRRSLTMALAAMVASAVYAMADAAAMQTADPAQFLFWVYLLVCLLLGGLAAFGGQGEGSIASLTRGWLQAPGRILAASVVSYGSYYLILMAFQMKGDPALVVAVRQVSIPVSVVLAALFLAEPRFRHRIGWAALLAVGVIIVINS